MNTITLHIGDVRDAMAGMADQSVDLLVTSPPFLALRSYLPADHEQKHLEIGSEATPAAYLDTLLELTQEWRRLLTPTGSLCVEIGDTYSGSGGAGGDYGEDGLRAGQPVFKANPGRSVRHQADGYTRGISARAKQDELPKRGPGWPLAKSLCGIPTLYTWSLAYGHNLLNPDHRFAPLRVRNLLVWTRPNPPVGALGDKFRPATSFVTVACESDRRWFDLDAVRTTLTDPGHTQIGKLRSLTGGDVDRENGDGRSPQNPAGAPPLDHWDDDQPDWQPLHNLPTHPYKGAHYATFNPALPRRLIEAMCPLAVCRECGEARRRITKAPTELHEQHANFAAAVRAARTALGLSQRDIDEHFGFNGMCSHWERAINGDQSQPAYPTPEQWAELRRLLAIDTDEFDTLITGYRRFADEQYTDEYRTHIERTRAEGFYTHTGNDGMARVGVRGPSITTGRTTLGWTKCDCLERSASDPSTKWRPGIVLDPFAGSGTTAVAAAHVGRDCILVDLDHRNVDLIRQRLYENFRVVSEKVSATRPRTNQEGRAGRTPVDINRRGWLAPVPRFIRPAADTIHWTVAPASRQELGAIAAGQEALW